MTKITSLYDLSLLPTEEEIVERYNKRENDPKHSPYESITPEYHTPLIATKIPGRNDPCPCRSGKKFKNCCIHKIKKEYHEK
jgi:uncharacterized protein YecA (UPF0149 family)